MPALSIGFEVHQPFRLNRDFAPDPKAKKKDLDNLYFDGVNCEILLRVAEKCYIPATTMILELMDENFSFAFSFSGTLIEQLEKWSPDALALFESVARHKNAEIIAQTYYHSIASCFADKTEFCEQIRLHQDLMHDLFHTDPAVLENTEFTFNNEIADIIQEMGFSGMYIEGADRILGGRSPNYLYICRNLPVLLRNIQLSDDIAFRFANHSWDKHPLIADTYADWVAQSGGDVVNVFLDYETFGEHMWQETGILEFLGRLPAALAERGVTTVLPSAALASCQPVGTVDVAETISWADLEKDTSAWMGNDRQQTAFHAIENAGTYAKDKQMWRYLQTSDHFYCMASKYGSCGEVHSYFCSLSGENAFKTYMGVLADFEERSLRYMKNRKAAKILRSLPPEKAFHFHSPSGYIGYAAYSLDQFCELLPILPNDSVRYHQERGDFASWAKDTLGDALLAERIEECREQQELSNLVNEWREQLWSHLR